LSRLVVHVAYYTDPLCPWSWAAEPALRRLQVEFGDELEITYVMVGMAREVDAPALLAATLDAVADSAMPADPRIWLAGAPRSSFPACLAVKAAGEQGLDGAYLRRLREGLMLRRERIDNAEVFIGAARDVGDLDVARFEIDLRSNAIVELFGADRERAGTGDDRPELPAFAFAGGSPVASGDVEVLRRTALEAGATPTADLPGPEAALRRFGPMGPPEVAAVCGLPAELARIELWRLAAEFRARATRHVCGELWQPA
jgi:predicted DsbA family dithiol-disulfide isomerase